MHSEKARQTLKELLGIAVFDEIYTHQIAQSEPRAFYRKRFWRVVLFLVVGALLNGSAVSLLAEATVANLTATQRAGTKLVDITYDLAAPGFDSVAMTLQVSSDGGATWTVPVTSATGAVGASVVPGPGKAIVWDAGADWPRNYTTQMRFRLVADDGVTEVPDFSYIPGGSFTMGRTSGDTDSDAPPTTVTVSPFYIQQTETTKAKWDEVRTWGLSNGYTDLAVGAGKAANHPVQTVNWWDVVKWCNARSEKEGLTPVYTVGGVVMRTGTTAPVANWSANGYRLPTEAEWEKAARGGIEGKRFPWGTDSISHAHANFDNDGGESFQSGTIGYHPSFTEGGTPFTSPVASFAPNGYGLYDMSGNVLEWCWDWYGSGYYATINDKTDPRGPTAGSYRVGRGGSWSYDGGGARCGDRFGVFTAASKANNFGFRTARSNIITGFALIPRGSLTIGRTSGDMDSDAPPTTVTLNAFYIQQTETTKAQWDEVRTWGLSNGYSDLALGGGKASNHPVHSVSWWDVVKWCNARSEKEGLTPVYTSGGVVMRTGTTVPEANWNANGHRLPTEAEWEKAARGGVSGKRFPWGTDTISHAQANYYGSSSYAYDQSPINNYHPSYSVNGFPYTSPAGSFAPNRYGLYDMSGNLWEWCWDWYDANYYAIINGTNDPRGPTTGSNRVGRGASWFPVAPYLRCANRDSGAPENSDIYSGFRTARSHVIIDLVEIPGGSFTMGRTSGDTDGNSPPTTVTVSPFYFQQTETTKAKWDEVRTWGLSNGYTDLAVGAGKAANHPVQWISWFDSVKWCNARSEKEGLTPVYTVGGVVMRTGTTAPVANWSANGYRLPTEAEWEKAARGGIEGKRFPWGTDSISHVHANFDNDGGESFQSGTTGYHPTYWTGSEPFTSPVGSFPANAHRLHDMAGNVFEWCWDWYSDGYIPNASDPRGPANGSNRIRRGGSWHSPASSARASFRGNVHPSYVGNYYGFRAARSSLFNGTPGPPPGSAESSNIWTDTRDLPTVTTPVVADISATGATLGGNVTNDGGADVIERGVVYSAAATNADPLIGGTGVVTITAIGTTGSFSIPVTGLTQGTAYIYKVYATNSLGTTYTSVAAFTTLSTNADLSALILSSGSLSPTFASGTIAYAASVSNATTSITVTPTVEQASATIEARLHSGNYAAVTSGSASDALALNVGPNTVDVRVTAEDGVTQRIYSITVTRDKAPQVIGFENPGPQVADATVNLTATGGDSGNPVTFSVASGPGAIEGNRLTFTGGGTVTVLADQAGNDLFHPAVSVEQSFVVNKAMATVNLGNLVQVADGTPRVATATTDPAGKLVRLTYDGSSVAPTLAGSYLVVGTIDDSIYQGSAIGTLVVNDPVLITSQPVSLTRNPGQAAGFSVVATGTAPITYQWRKGGQPIEGAVNASLAIDPVAEGDEGSYDVVVTNVVGSVTSNPATLSVNDPVLITGEPLGRKVAPKSTVVFRVIATGTAPITYQWRKGGQPIDGATEATHTMASVEETDQGSYDVVVSNMVGSVTSLPALLDVDHRHGKELQEPTDEAEEPVATDIGWEDAGAGLYDGLLTDQADGRTLVGAIGQLLVTRPKAGASTGGLVSGVVRLRGRSALLRGAMDTNGLLETSLRQKDGSVLVVSLQLGRTTGGAEVLRGTVQWNGLTAVASLPRAPFHAKLNPLSDGTAGLYTMLVPSAPGSGTTEPGGDGWASVSVGLGGVITVRGLLGDGVKFAETAYLSADREASLYAEPYASKPEPGRIGGRLVFREQAGVSDFDGKLQWRKFPDPKAAQYGDGFEVETWALGSRYVAPLPGQRVLGQLADQHYNAELTLIGATAPLADGNATSRVLSWLSTNRLVHYGPQLLSGAATAKSGVVTGTFLDPATRVKVIFSGVAFQKQGLVGGVFVQGRESGAVRIQPGTDFAYPGSEAAGEMLRLTGPAGAPTEPVEDAVAFVPEAGGLYGGILIRQGDGTAGSGALESLIVQPSGAISGVLWIEGERLPFKGTLFADGSSEVRILRKTGPAVVLRLQLVKIDDALTDPDDGYGFQGTVSVDDGVTVAHGVDAQRKPAYTKLTRAPEEGGYTLAMRAPDGVDGQAEPGGDGYGAMRVDYTGLCTGLVVLADGTRVSLGGQVGREYDDGGTAVSEWSFHRGLYGKIPQGYVAGKLHFRRSPGIGEVDGQWHWVKRARAALLTVYPAGFERSRPVVGGRYVPPVAGTRALAGVEDAWWNVWLRFAGPDLSAFPGLDLMEVDRVASWTVTNRLVYFGPETVKVSFDPKTGLLGGSYVDPTQGVTVTFGGALLQEQGLVTGLYVTPAGGGRVTGLFTVEPRDVP